MPKRVSHPFTIHIQSRACMRGRFHWAIRRGRRIVSEPALTYETFEDARLAGKDALEQIAAAWRREAAFGEAA
jgi:hypothetical protein